MTDRFDKFTERARKTLQLAQEEAQRLNHGYIDTGHILLGLVREERGIAGQVLKEMGADLEKARAAAALVMEPAHEGFIGQIGLTPHGKRSIELAVDNARGLGHHYIGTEHLLLGILEVNDKQVEVMLKELGLNGEDVRAAVIKKLAESDKIVEPQGLLERMRRRVQSSLPYQAPAESGPTISPGSAGSRDRFDRFTERARKTLQFAQEEAERFNHNYIGTEHILLGLVREGDGMAARVLNNLGIELDKVRSSVEFIIGRGERMVMGQIGLTPRAKRVIELAVDEARNLNHHYIGTEHLLLGLVREGEGIAAGILESLGASLERVRMQMIEVLKSSSGYSVRPTGVSGQGIGDQQSTAGSSQSALSLELLRMLFEYSIWARDQLLPLIEELGEEERKQGEQKGGYGSIHDTLAHMAQSEWLWIQRCMGESPLRLPKGEDFATLTVLIEWWNDVHAQAMLYLNSITEENLGEEVTYLAPDGKRRTRKIWHMLVQVPNHQTEHRSQVAGMLGEMGLEVPQTDMVVYLSRPGAQG